jgi:GGDEF domain-containing protein
MRTASEDSVTEHLRAESAITDPVTGLRNKLGMEDLANELLEETRTVSYDDYWK